MTQPRGNRLALVRCMSPDGNLMPPLGVLYLASIAESLGWHVQVFDEHERKGRLLKDIIEWEPRVVGFSSVTASFNRSVAVAEALKSQTKRSIVVFGGPHPTLCPAETLARTVSIDCVMVGESEASFQVFLTHVGNGLDPEGFDQAGPVLPNLVYRTSSGPSSPTLLSLLDDEALDSLPFPAFHLLNLPFYFTQMRHGIFSPRGRGLPIMATRGCPHTCTFCCRIMGRKIRKRSPENIVAEIVHLRETYELDSIYFEDDNFTYDMTFAKEVLTRILDQTAGSLRIKFANGLRVDRVDHELLDLMKAAGAYHLSFGIESGSFTTLRRMKKPLNLTHARDVVALAKAKGFLVGANCIIGYPGETLSELRESVRFFLKLPLDSSAIVNLIPFPRTEVEIEARKEGILTDLAKNYDNYYYRLFRPNILIRPTDMSERRLSWEIKRAYMLFYLRPRTFGRIAIHSMRAFVSGLKNRIASWRGMSGKVRSGGT